MIIKEEDLKLYPEIDSINTADYKNKRFGNLIALYHSHALNGRNIWVCKCDCGNYCIIPSDKLANGESKRCGCSCKLRRNKLHDLTGKKFGRLTVLERDGVTKDLHSKWKCRCDCGNITYVSGRYLEGGQIISCGNCPDKVTSIGNLKVQDWLNKNHYYFIREYRFQDCRNINPLPFDFVVFNNEKEEKIIAVIEYQGTQHFFSTGGWSTNEHVKETQKRDKIKRDYCLQHHYNFITINYDEDVDSKLVSNFSQARQDEEHERYYANGSTIK